MLQSEFFERTGVPLPQEDYEAVERLYNAVIMNKDEFCKNWLLIKDNPLLGELSAGIKKLNDECIEKDASIRFLTSQHDEVVSKMEREAKKQAEAAHEHFLDFGKKLVKAQELGSSFVYDEIEQEFGIGYIIKTKWEEGIELDYSEIEYMVKKL